MSGPQRAVRVLVADDHPVVRQGLRAMLSSDQRIEVVGEAAGGEESIELVEQLNPDVVLMDIRMPKMSGIEATRLIKGLRPDVAVIMITMYDNRTFVVEALRAGAAGYLVKDSSRELFCYAIHAVMDGCAMVRSDLLRQAIQGLTRGSKDLTAGNGSPQAADRLTAREMEVLRLVSHGCLNKEIAKALSLAEVTVKKYVQSIMAKLGVSDRTNAAITAVRLGLVE